MEEEEGGLLGNVMRENEIAVYPNPTNGAFTVRVMQPGSYEILTSLGDVKQVIGVVEESGAFEVTGLAAGVYFVRESINPLNIRRIVVL
jgi:predicted  nucleic acid-binding Zn-ribbon protein